MSNLAWRVGWKAGMEEATINGMHLEVHGQSGEDIRWCVKWANNHAKVFLSGKVPCSDPSQTAALREMARVAAEKSASRVLAAAVRLMEEQQP